MLTDEYRRFISLKNNKNIFFAFFKGAKYLFRQNFFLFFYKIYKLLTFIIFGNSFKINLDKSIKLNNINLNEVFKKFNTDKASQYIHNKKITKGHNFADFYEIYFHKLKNNNINILELGVLKGDSTASFYHYFNNCKLYSIDINKRNFKYKSKSI